MNWLSDPNAWAARAALTSIEIVLGIDNIIFITILVGRLPEADRQRARIVGLLLAMGMRLALLFSLTWFMGLGGELFRLFDHAFSARDLILIVGGLFLLAKATFEIHGKLESVHEGPEAAAISFAAVLVQIALLDMVFSIDSVITAIGLAEELMVMVIAVVVAVLVMLVSAKPIGDFVERHPTLKMLALSFLLLIGTTLVADGLGFHFPKGYVYFAMAFSAFVEMLNLRLRKMTAHG
ncbi:MAG: TerC family protein [Acidobacteriota bacterium]|nr:TerC family protein [Acidobacteriota bacterium]